MAKKAEAAPAAPVIEEEVESFKTLEAMVADYVAFKARVAALIFHK